MNSTKSKLNVKLLRRIKRHILEEPLRFQMISLSQFGRPGDTVYVGEGRDQPLPECGTTQCIAGWANTLSGKEPLGSPALARAASLLGLQRSGSSVFFDSDWPEPFKTRYRLCKTPRGRAKVGADRIEHLITTGE